MPDTPSPSPCWGLDDIYLTRPLVLAAVLIIAGHVLRGTGPTPANTRSRLEEVMRHG
jgi:hypothetical protein